MFTKVTPGRACKIAEVLGAKWVYIEGWQEAQLNGKVIAYSDIKGFFVSEELNCVDVSNILA